MFFSQPVNLDFESTVPGVYTTSNAVSGWTISSQSPTSCAGSTVWTAGSPEFSVRTTPILNAFPFYSIQSFSPLAMSPLGGNNIAQLNDFSATGLRTRMVQTFSVSGASQLFEYVYAGMWQDGGHICCEQAHVKINFYNSLGNPLPLVPISVNATGSLCPAGAPGFSVTNGWTWAAWQHEYVDLTPYIGTFITVEVISGDCVFGTHAGTTYFDSRAWTGLIGTVFSGGNAGNYTDAVNFCQGANVAQISAPAGYTAYQWYAPNSLNQPIPIGSANGGNTPLVTINNPTAGVVYTVQLTTSNGFTLTQLDTLKFSMVSITSATAYSSCPNGASGSAVVVSDGSGSGYNYSWVNSMNATVSTGSTAANLIPGVYTVSVSAAGSPGCGSATANVTVGVGPANVITVIKPFCALQNLTLTAPPGSSRQWYSGTVAISPALSGTASAIAVISPTTGQSIWLAYNSPQGCRDSINFLLNQTSPGTLSLPPIPVSCPGASNSAVSITMTPAAGVVPGFASFSVFSNASPQYSMGVSQTSLNVFTASGLSAGTYSVIAYDGSCNYTNSFVLSDLIFNFQVGSPTVCVGNSATAGVSFSSAISPGQYQFSWSPVQNIVGGNLNANYISIAVVPALTATAGINVFSVTVTPTVAACPMTKTLSVTSLTLPTPALSSVPQPFCNNSGTKTITAAPPGGIYGTSGGSWLNSSTGIVTPTLMLPGTYVFTYVLSAGSCSTSVSGSISVSQFNSAALTTSALSICNNSVNCLNLFSLTQNNNGIWSGTGVSSNSFCPLNLSAGQYTLSYLNASSPNTTLCPASQAMTVTVISSAILGITTPTPFCNNASSFVMPVVSAGGAWSSPIPGLVSQAGIVSPSSAPGGPVTLTYTGVCGNTATVNLNTGLFHPAGLTLSAKSICKDSPALNLMSVTISSVNGTWSGAGVSNNIFTPTISAGTYTLLYGTASSNPPLCPDQASLTVTVNDLPVLGLPAITGVCAGESATVLPTGASNYSLNGIYFPAAIVLSPSVTTTYTITGETFGCVSQKTLSIGVLICTGIIESTTVQLSSVYPNPTHGELNIELGTKTKIILSDAFGKTVLEQEMEAGKHQLDLQHLPQAIYFLKFSDQTKAIKISKAN